jgi:hypothetical protein
MLQPPSSVIAAMARTVQRTMVHLPIGDHASVNIAPELGARQAALFPPQPLLSFLGQ